MKGASATGGITNTIIKASFTPLPIRHRTLIHRQTIILALFHPMEHQMQVILMMILRILNELGGVRKVESMDGPRNVLPQHSEQLQAVTIPPNLQIATTIPLHTVVSPCLIDRPSSKHDAYATRHTSSDKPSYRRSAALPASERGRPPQKPSQSGSSAYDRMRREDTRTDAPGKHQQEQKKPIPEMQIDTQDRALGKRAWRQKQRVDEIPGRLIEMAIAILESRHPDKLTG